MKISKISVSKISISASIVFFFSALNVLADNNGPPDFCRTPTPAAFQRMTSLPQGTYAAWWPEFFVDHSSGSTKYYAALMCSGSIHTVTGGNCVVDLATGKIANAPGTFDGQWVKDPEDEAIFTIPNKYYTAKGGALPGLSFYHFDDVLARGKAAPLLYRDPTFGNHYHSFGLVERGVDASGQRYAINRALNDKWGVSMRDYKFTLDNNGRVLSIVPFGPERNLTNGPGETEEIRRAPVGHADPNGNNSFFDLPMISRDAKYFAANNRRTMSTQIFELSDSGKRLVADLGIETGKISFAPRAPDAKDMYIAFHVDQIDPAEGDKMSGVPPGMTKDIIVMRLVERPGADGRPIFDPGQMVRVTASDRLGDGNYYPKWVNEKELIYIESRNNNRQSFVKVNLDELRFQNNLVPRPSTNIAKKQYAAAAALGFYYTSNCTNFAKQLTAKEAALYSMNLSRESCKQLANSWESWKNIVGYSTELFSLRPPKAPGTQRVRGYNFNESGSHRGAERFEKPIGLQDVTSLTASDLTAICDQLQ